MSLLSAWKGVQRSTWESISKNISHHPTKEAFGWLLRICFFQKVPVFFPTGQENQYPLLHEKFMTLGQVPFFPFSLWTWISTPIRLCLNIPYLHFSDDKCFSSIITFFDGMFPVTDAFHSSSQQIEDCSLLPFQYFYEGSFGLLSMDFLPTFVSNPPHKFRTCFSRFYLPSHFSSNFLLFLDTSSHFLSSSLSLFNHLQLSSFLP